MCRARGRARRCFAARASRLSGPPSLADRLSSQSEDLAGAVSGISGRSRRVERVIKRDQHKPWATLEGVPAAP